MFKLSQINRDDFIVPFEQMLNEMLASHNKQLTDELGEDFYKGSYPKVDIVEYSDRLVLEADVGGLTKEEVSAEIDGDYLIISGGNKKRDIPQKDVKYIYREIKRSSFKRSFLLGDNIDKTKVNASFENGYLTVTLPRVKVEEKVRKVKLL